MDIETLRTVMRERIPFYHVLPVEVIAVAPERVEVALAFTPSLRNHVEMMHAGAQFGLGEAAGGAMSFVAFADFVNRGAAPLVTEVTISYLRSARSDLRAVATLSADEQARARSEMIANGRATFSIPVQVFDVDEKLIAELRSQWVLLGPRT